VVSEGAAEEITLDAITLGVTVLLAETATAGDRVMLLLLVVVEASSVADCAKAIEAAPKRSVISDGRMMGWCLFFFVIIQEQQMVRTANAAAVWCAGTRSWVEYKQENKYAMQLQ
jgi:hypothetical protein